MAEKKLLVPNIGDFKNVEVIEVLVKSGQQIKKNDPLITLESDKSSVEVPATDEGKINKIIVKVGDKVSEGSEILSLDSVSKNEESKKTVDVKENIPEKKIVTETPKEIAPVVNKLSKDDFPTLGWPMMPTIKPLLSKAPCWAWPKSKLISSYKSCIFCCCC